MSTFPDIGLPDQSTWEETQDDPAIRSKMEGGQKLTRARSTRRPRKTWTFGYENLSDAGKKALQDFWDEMKGGSESFQWTHPFEGTVHTVRFAEKFTAKYFLYHKMPNGEPDHRWRISNVKLEEV